MKDRKNFYTVVFLALIVVFCSYLLGQKVFNNSYKQTKDGVVEDSDYGRFLAAQHALYVNDFDNASRMINSVNANNESVKKIKSMTDFFSGKMPENAASFKDSKDLLNGLIYDAYLIQKDDWKNVYNRHTKDSTILAAPLRIFSGIKQGKTKEVKKFVDDLKVNDSWKAFVLGQIAVLNNDVDAAAKEFAKVHPDFMNVNDYLYLMSFYQENEMFEDMEILRNDFLAKIGGMYMFDYKDIPDWSNYAGYKNNLVFSIIQNISHTQIMIYTDLSLMFLRFAQIISDDANTDAINYYLGQYYFQNSGDYKTCFSKIKKSSPLYLFGKLNIAERDNDIRAMKKMVLNNPLFMPAVQNLVRYYIKTGDKHGALSILNRALKHKNVSEEGMVFFLKQRVHVYLMFGDVKHAQQDLYAIKSASESITPDIMSLQARTWLMQDRNLEEAYNYAMMLVKNNTSDVFAWDLVGQIVAKKESVDNALDIMKSVVTVATNASSIYEHLGDLYVQQGDKEQALRSYNQALDLSDDGLIVVPFVQKKIRNLK